MFEIMTVIQVRPRVILEADKYLNGFARQDQYGILPAIVHEAAAMDHFRTGNNLVKMNSVNGVFDLSCHEWIGIQ